MTTTSTASATQPSTALAVIAERTGVTPAELKSSLMSTAFKGANEAQFMTLIAIAAQYRLNPFTREIYAFPSARGIVPVVSIDGWLRIINEHPAFDGLETTEAAETTQASPRAKECPLWMEVKIYRKDRSRPTVIREYLDETYRDVDGAWQTHTKRMLRHKAIIQAARVAFGLALSDPDEAARNAEELPDPYDAAEITAAELVSQEQVQQLQAAVLSRGYTVEHVEGQLQAQGISANGLAGIPASQFAHVLEVLINLPVKSVAPAPTAEPSGMPKGPDLLDELAVRQVLLAQAKEFMADLTTEAAASDEAEEDGVTLRCAGCGVDIVPGLDDYEMVADGEGQAPMCRTCLDKLAGGTRDDGRPVTPLLLRSLRSRRKGLRITADVWQARLMPYGVRSADELSEAQARRLDTELEDELKAAGGKP